MGMLSIDFFGSYSPVGDVIVLGTCFVFAVLMHNAYISDSDAYSLFRRIIFVLYLSANFSIVFHVLLVRRETVPHFFLYLFLILYHVSLYLQLLLYIQYMKMPLRMNADTFKHMVIPAYIVFGVCTLYEIIAPITGWGFYITENKEIHEGFNFFPVGYCYFVLTIMYLLIAYRKRVYRQVINGIMFSTLISFLILLLQIRNDNSSFTVASYLFPAFAILYMIHSNPYDLEIGAVDALAFEQIIDYANKRGRKMLIMSLLLVDLDIEGKEYPEAIKDAVRRFAGEYFKGATLFQVSNGRLFLVVDMSKNPSYEQIINRMLNSFDEEYPKYKLDYKIIITPTMDRIVHGKDYIGLIHYAESGTALDTVHIVDETDVEEFLKHKYILEELMDICKKKDLDDPRVEVFCQPVLNIETKKYDTAEALMRISLRDTGRIFPDVFIPMAEEHGLIHQLSLIILHKTCERIREMMVEGYNIQRISINISALELRDDDFCKDVSEVIKNSGIPFGKVAIELTESQSESDFRIMKKKILELKENGIKFYLDDFGTGYSNFERIMELPFDIIKFDRSMVLASNADEKSEKMVSHLAGMFSEMNYSVLYEGVETDTDEEHCVKMNAKYLQGYKYSRPIPLERLTEYFEKDVS